MGSRVKCCCVPRCNDKVAKRHSITIKEIYQNIWLQRINNKKLLSLERKKLKSYYICDIHFEDVCKEPNGRLRNGSLPTLYLPDYRKVENDNFYMSSPELEKNAIPAKVQEAIKVLEASSSRASGSSPVGSVIMPRKVYGKKRLFADDIDPGSDTEKHTSVEKTDYEVLYTLETAAPLQGDIKVEFVWDSTNLEQASSPGPGTDIDELLDQELQTYPSALKSSKALIMAPPSCFVVTCFYSHPIRHRFPDPKKYLSLFLEWKELCANPRLSEDDMTPEKIYNNCRVCHRHFTKDCMMASNRLIRGAKPTLHMPGSIVEGPEEYVDDNLKSTIKQETTYQLKPVISRTRIDNCTVLSLIDR